MTPAERMSAGTNVIRTGDPRHPLSANPCMASGPGGFVCTRPEGHMLGDVPHVGEGVTAVLAIWDDMGRAVSLALDGVGASL